MLFLQVWYVYWLGQSVFPSQMFAIFYGTVRFIHKHKKTIYMFLALSVEALLWVCRRLDNFLYAEGTLVCWHPGLQITLLNYSFKSDFTPFQNSSMIVPYGCLFLFLKLLSYYLTSPFGPPSFYIYAWNLGELVINLMFVTTYTEMCRFSMHLFLVWYR